MYVRRGEGVFIRWERWGEVTRWREERRTRKVTVWRGNWVHGLRAAIAY